MKKWIITVQIPVLGRHSRIVRRGRPAVAPPLPGASWSLFRGYGSKGGEQVDARRRNGSGSCRRRDGDAQRAAASARPTRAVSGPCCHVRSAVPYLQMFNFSVAHSSPLTHKPGKDAYELALRCAIAHRRN